MRKCFSLVLLAMLVLFPSCTETETVYRTDLSAQQISDGCASALSGYSLLSAADEDYITYRMLLDESIMESCAIYIQNAGTSIDEYGIIKGSSDDTVALEEIIRDYLARRNEEWTGQYLVEEYPKLRDAEYKKFGSYVVYGILSEEDKDIFFKTVEEFIKE